VTTIDHAAFQRAQFSLQRTNHAMYKGINVTKVTVTVVYICS